MRFFKNFQMSKKGVSAEEKRNRMLQLFFEKGECFQLKVIDHFLILYTQFDLLFVLF